MRRLGVEEELLLVDASDGRPRAVGGVLQALSGPGNAADADGGVEAELHQQQIEIGTAPTASLSELRRELVRRRQGVDALARARDARVAALGTCPLPVVPRATVKPRYQKMITHLGLTTAEQLTCGCHVHVDVDSADEGAAVLDRIRVWLPVLVALSANSPFWQGRDSGYASFRTQAWHRFPTAGPTPLFGSGAAYRRHVDALLATEVPIDEGMIYFDARLSRSYPTVEVRVADVCLAVDDAVLVAALVRGLTDRAGIDWRSGVPAPNVPTDLLRMATWRASRFGTAGTLLHPDGWRPAPAWEVVDALLDHVGAALTATGDGSTVGDRLDVLRRSGSGADRQRRIAGDGLDLVRVVQEAIDLTVSS